MTVDDRQDKHLREVVVPLVEPVRPDGRAVVVALGAVGAAPSGPGLHEGGGHQGPDVVRSRMPREIVLERHRREDPLVADEDIGGTDGRIALEVQQRVGIQGYTVLREVAHGASNRGRGPRIEERVRGVAQVGQGLRRVERRVGRQMRVVEIDPVGVESRRILRGRIRASIVGSGIHDSSDGGPGEASSLRRRFAVVTSLHCKATSTGINARL